MKQILTAVLFFTLLAAYGQTIVSTSPENKNVLLEEFTGIYCGYCPDGHAIGQALKDSHPNDVFLINIHTGGYANPSGGDPDFRTVFGAAIAAQSGLTGYPAGTVNRHLFPGTSQGSGTAQSRGTWTSTANQVLTQAAYVNTAVEFTYDNTTRELNVHVEAYYTGDSPESSNLLNVALLQDNTLGPQSGGGAGNNYVHMHRLVHLITGQWGDAITTTTEGTFVDRNYTYTIPADYRGIDALVNDMKLVVFITETHQEVAQASGVSLLQPIGTNNVAVLEASISDSCANLTSIFEVNNLGSDEITALSIDYSINGGAETGTINWTGNLMFNEKTELLLNIPITTIETNNTIDFDVTEVNGVTDDDTTNNTTSTTFGIAPSEDDDYLKVTIQTDAKGSETSWVLKDSNDLVVASGDSYANNQTYHQELNLDGDCYTFILTDTGGDGGAKYILKGTSGTIYYSLGNDYTSLVVKDLNIINIASVHDVAFANSLIYPNPAQTVLTIENAAGLNMELYDLSGRVLFSKKNISTDENINLEAYSEGVYLLKLSDGYQTRTEKVLISK